MFMKPTAAILEIVFFYFPSNIERGIVAHSSTLSKVGLPKTPEKLSFHQNGHGIQKNDPTKTQVILTQIDIFCISSGGSRGGGGVMVVLTTPSLL